MGRVGGGGYHGSQRPRCEAACLSQDLRRAEPEARVKLPSLLARGEGQGQDGAGGYQGTGSRPGEGVWGERPPHWPPSDCEQEEAGNRAWSAQGSVSGWFARRKSSHGLVRVEGRCPTPVS